MDPRDRDEIARRPGVRLLLQFGSSVSGPTHPRSDLDLAVLLGRRRLSLAEFAELRAPGPLTRTGGDEELASPTGHPASTPSSTRWAAPDRAPRRARRAIVRGP